MVKTTFIAEPGKQEVVLISYLNAPRQLVCKAFADPELLKQWWGPKIYKNTIDKFDLRPGGIWRFIQRDADGNEFAFHGVFHEVAFPERLVQTFEYEGMPGHVILETITFEELDGMTRITDQSVYQSVTDRDGMVQSGMEGGATESMENIAELLAKVRVR